MEYEDDIAEQQARRRRSMLQIALAAAAFIIVCGLLYAYDRTLGLSADERFDKEIAENAAMAPAYAALAKEFPYEYRKMKRTTVESYYQTKKGRVTDYMPEGFVSKFMQGYAPTAMFGGTRETIAFLDSFSAMYQAAEKDPEFCKALVNRRNSAEGTAILQSRPSYGKMFAAFITLVRAGQAHPVQREQVSPAEIFAFMKETRAMVEKEGGLRPQTAEDSCRSDAALFRAFATFPPERKEMVAAFILQFLQ